MTTSIKLLKPKDTILMESLLDVFGEAFNERSTYSDKRPSREYLEDLLQKDYFITLVAMDGNAVIGGLVAYELKKFEQPRSEVYIYDLAVLEDYRRKGVATALINELKIYSKQRGAYVIFVQADTGEEDQAAISLYSKLGHREDVLHFDILVDSHR